MTASFRLKLFIFTFLVVVTLSTVKGHEGHDDEEEKGGEDVVILTDENFDTENGAFENSLVMFHAPWCGHCKRLSPEFAKAATILKDDDPNPVTLVKVDCTEGGKDTCKRFNIRGYPTVKIFQNGEFVSDYKGKRESNGIVEYMRKEVSNDPDEKKSEL